ncbi:MAG TPA: ABC transporter substrate-binding protein [Acidimicrobiales bacterium]|nr:ABC transporter substrate-binding protein [Acidimicrobiales bacterium]
MGVVGVALAAVVLTGCHAATRLGVPTTVYQVDGHCDTSAVVEVGASLPLSGSDSAAGHAQLVGLELAVNEVNATGGVLTAHRCLELLYKDDRSDPAVDNQALLDLVNQEKVSFLVGPFLALDNPANLDHIGALGTTAASYPALAVTFKPSEFPDTFPIASSMADQASVLVAAAKRQHLDRVALVRSSSRVAAEGAAAFRSDARSAGLIVAATTFVVDSRATATSAWARLRAGHPSAVAVFDSGSTLAPLLNARRGAGSTLPVLASTQGAPVLPTAVATGVQVIVPKSLVVSRHVPTSLESFRARVLRTLHQAGLDGPITPYAQGYDAVQLFASAANGVDADDSGSVRTFIENANFEGLLGTYDYTSSDHEGLAASQLAVAPLASLSNGLYVAAESG